jgi:parallel beta-helix repeat protein
MFTLLLVGMLTLAFNIQPARAEAAVYIRVDGSIDPLTAPISTVDNVTYTFIDNLFDWRVVVERDNIVIDGAGYTLQGDGNVGVDLSRRTNVTVCSMLIMGFGYGIMLLSSSNCSVSGNTIAYNWDRGIYLTYHSSNNSVSGNTITANTLYGILIGTYSYYNRVCGNNITANNGDGMLIWSYNNVCGNTITANSGSGMLIGSYNNVSGNTITGNNEYGIRLNEGSSNSVSNNTIANNGDGIWLAYSSSNSISGNTITNNIEGITFYPSNGNSVSGNTIADNCNIGIWFHESSGNNVYGNNIANNGKGIEFVYSSNNKVRGNTFKNNGIVIDACMYACSAENNTVNGKPLVYLIGQANCSVSDAGQVILVGCDTIRVENLNLSRTNIGVYLLGTNNTIISGNIITANDAGIMFDYSYNNSVVGNTISNNGRGIWFWFHGNNDIIYHNNFIDNTEQVGNTFDSSNVWDDSYPSGGNYWSDFATRYPDASEFDNSGIWNRPYVIDENNQDRYPLIHPYPPITSVLAIAETIGGTTDPAPGAYAFINVSEIQVTAIPDAGFTFDYWLLDAEKRTENPLTILMDASHSLQAFFVDNVPPEIGDPIQVPPENVQPYQNVAVTTSVTDFGTGVYNVTLWYSLDNGTIWIPSTMVEISTNTYQTVIPGYENCTWVTYKIVAYDNAGNPATKSNNGYGFKYHVIPEFPSATILPLFMVLSILSIVFAKRKILKKRGD